MLEIVNALLPIVLLVITGVVLLRSGFLDTAFRQGLDKFVYWVALPALIVAAMSDSPGLAGAGAMIAVFMIATLVVMVVACGVAFALRLPGAGFGVFVQASFRGNLAFVGLPVIQLATGGDAAVMSQTVLVFAPAVLLYNVLAVPVLTLAQHKLDRGAPKRVAKSMVNNPLLIACAVGLVMIIFKLALPGPIHRSLELLGNTAAPLALISLGGAIVTYPVHRQIVAGLFASLLKLAAMPAMVLWLAWIFGLPTEQRLILMILASAPTAVASYVLAIKLDGDPALAASTVSLSTILSCISLGIALALAS